MPAGDAHRQWFPAMIDILREHWAADLSWQQLAALSARLDATLQQIRKERNIQPPMFTCPCCGTRRRSAFPHVTVNATLFAAGRFGVCSKEEAGKLSRRWMKHKKEQGLDPHGAKARAGSCTAEKDEG